MWFSWLLCNYMGHTSPRSRTLFPASFFKKQKSMRLVVVGIAKSNLLGGFSQSFLASSSKLDCTAGMDQQYIYFLSECIEVRPLSFR